MPRCLCICSRVQTQPTFKMTRANYNRNPKSTQRTIFHQTRREEKMRIIKTPPDKLKLLVFVKKITKYLPLYDFHIYWNRLLWGWFSFSFRSCWNCFERRQRKYDTMILMMIMTMATMTPMMTTLISK